jgi:hypothetical protein
MFLLFTYLALIEYVEQGQNEFNAAIICYCDQLGLGEEGTWKQDA